MFGVDGAEAVLLLLLALFLIGPERLPEYAERLREFVRTAKGHVSGATDDLKETLGPELAEVDWRRWDPRRYDPRHIVRQALLEDDEEPAPASPPRPARGPQPVLAGVRPGAQAPFDTEAT